MLLWGERERGLGGLGWQNHGHAPAAGKAEEVGKGREQWDSASVTLQQGLELGNGDRAQFLFLRIYVNKSAER